MQVHNCIGNLQLLSMNKGRACCRGARFDASSELLPTWLESNHIFPRFYEEEAWAHFQYEMTYQPQTGVL